LLESLGLESLPKTSGRRGLHVVVPVHPRTGYDRAAAFAEAVMRRLEARLPERTTTERSPSRRRGRLYLDALQNAYGKTMVAPYSLRAVDGAPVSTPLRWSEVHRRLDPTRFNLKTLPRRLDRVGDLFALARTGKQDLPDLEP
jgi:bifunctional non-homologous end joining protein LigD